VITFICRMTRAKWIRGAPQRIPAYWWRRSRPGRPRLATAFAMPADHGRGSHEHESVPPSRPTPTQSYPEKSIDGTEPRSPITSGEQLQLMSQSEVFEDEVAARS
jgi:hypothetical protein